MQVMFWQSPLGNFGDDVNRWIWDRLLPGHAGWAGETTLVGVGSLLGDGFDLPAGRKLVVGTGSGYGSLPDVRDGTWDIRCVRGPKTAEALGLPREIGVADPVSALCRQPDFAGLARSEEVLFVPHWQSATQPDLDWPALCARAGIGYQSPCADAGVVVRRIAGARLVLAESLHAAIVADAFRVPWHAVWTTAASFKRFKWEDWTESLELPFTVHNLLAPLDRLAPAAKAALGRKGRVLTRRAVRTPTGGGRLPWRARASDAVLDAATVRSLRRVAALPPNLSRDEVHERQLDRFEEILRSVARDYGSA
jgi:succinoglycan biosynthesis protein ExoV